MRSVVCLPVTLLGVGLTLSCAPLSALDLTEGNYTYTVADNQAIITGFNIYYSGELSITNNLAVTPSPGSETMRSIPATA